MLNKCWLSLGHFPSNIVIIQYLRCNIQSYKYFTKNSDMLSFWDRAHNFIMHKKQLLTWNILIITWLSQKTNWLGCPTSLLGPHLQYCGRQLWERGQSCSSLCHHLAHCLVQRVRLAYFAVWTHTDEIVTSPLCPPPHLGWLIRLAHQRIRFIYWVLNQGFALDVPSAWNAVPPHSHRAAPHFSASAQMWLPLRESFLDLSSVGPHNYSICFQHFFLVCLACMTTELCLLIHFLNWVL